MVRPDLIFHLSYDFPNENKSVNTSIPHEACTVQYQDLDFAVRQCLQLLKDRSPVTKIWYGISDLKSAFRLVPLMKKRWILLVMKAKNLITNKWCYFVDKCLPFGSSISCRIFQRFSNALAHITNFKLKHIPDKGITNYLDDFLKLALSEALCNEMIQMFHTVCEALGYL